MEDTIKIELLTPLTGTFLPNEMEQDWEGEEYHELEEEQEFLEDMETLAEAMKLLQYDYLGGNGSRGYGKIQFQGIIRSSIRERSRWSAIWLYNLRTKGISGNGRIIGTV